MENIDQSKIEDFRQMINFSKSSAKQNKSSLLAIIIVMTVMK
ncbi:hypothetical protein [Lactobacillus taiwanensis]|nr:hypothetical protein [Lactobacillus taiwanensis]